MPQYSIAGFEKHWVANLRRFHIECAACWEIFVELISMASDIGALLSGRRVLEVNCAYLVLMKTMNHVASTLLLVERGLMVDAALTSRNALETLLLLELLAKKPELCVKWSAGEQFTPGTVRKQLASLPRVEVGDLAIEVSSDTWDDTRFVYDWLSRITHANLNSLNHFCISIRADSFELHVGGAPSLPVTVAITKSLSYTSLRSLATCLAVYEPSALQTKSPKLKRLEDLLNSPDMKETI